MYFFGGIAAEHAGHGAKEDSVTRVGRSLQTLPSPVPESSELGGKQVLRLATWKVLNIFNERFHLIKPLERFKTSF